MEILEKDPWRQKINLTAMILGVDPSVVEAGRGLGMTERQILVKIQIPLSTRVIMAGVRTATVINIGIATLATYIGAGGLGEPIKSGLSLNDANMILAGAIPAAILALLVDYLFSFLEKRIAPKGLRVAG